MTATLPAGWKLVPIEPTKEMWAAVNKLDDEMAAGAYDGRGASIEQAWNCLVDAAPTPPAATQDDTLARTGNTADHQEGWFAGVDHGRAEARASAQDDAKDEQAAFEEWLERTCPSGDVEAVQRQWEASSDYADFHAPAAGDARDAARYRTWRDAMVAEDTEFRLTVAAALPSEVGDTRPPTSAEWDAGIDAAIAAQQGKGGGA
ncbi:hypothetical protein RA224_12830 [Achromobacter aegrifaciens]|uniref:hypothetical protein n=1 Tax=Achromobacter aegrifaciens TaxID=1287736 RepID=UPI0027BB198B|nr:hypothetical protein [Achromobacter aegrifaciens]WLW64269.1 hypothetical protein RA224_12830 [Achromobacter aegrifaciens]